MKYKVYLNGHASASVEVEADDIDEAREKAENEVYVSLCHQCAHEVEVSDDWETHSVYDDTDHLVWTRSEENR